MGLGQGQALANIRLISVERVPEGRDPFERQDFYPQDGI